MVGELFHAETLAREKRRVIMKYRGVPLLPILTAAATTVVFVKYRLSMRAERLRLQGRSTVIPSPYGDIEYTEHGIGPDVLVIHAQDDTLQPYRNAEFFASTIPDAYLLRFQNGGHIVALIEVEKVREAVQQHILAHAGEMFAQVPTPESAGV
jgi:pimeloyl-ACP methyl ester carboxylesterase